MPRPLLPILLAAVVGLPAVYYTVMGIHLYDTSPVLGMGVFGLAIVGAAFELLWGAELAELEMSPNLALVLLALVAVLPEYAVDIYLAYSAGGWSPEPGATGAGLINVKQGLALANMTGANRILIGLGWPVIALIGWFSFQRPSIRLELARSVDIFWLGNATLYSCLIPLKGTITIFDTVFLLLLYGAYLWTCSKVPSRESHLQGPAAWLATFRRPIRLAATWGLFVFAAGIIFISSHPFAESLIAGGEALGIDEFLLVQWLAPFASESPEFLAVILLALKGAGTDGLGTLVSAKVNQWSLLVGMVPFAYAIGHQSTHGHWEGGFAIDARQTEELVLTTCQSLYALTTVMSFRFRLADAVALLGLFLLQLIVTIVLEETHNHHLVTGWHYLISGLYVVLFLFGVYKHRAFLPAIFRGAMYLDGSTYESVMRGDPEYHAELAAAESDPPPAAAH